MPTRTIVLVGEASLFAAALGTGIVFSVARSSANDRYETANRTVLAALVGSDDRKARACSHAARGLRRAGPSARQDRDRGRARSRWAASSAAGVSAAAFGLTYWLWPRESAPVEVQAAVARRAESSSRFSGRF